MQFRPRKAHLKAPPQASLFNLRSESMVPPSHNPVGNRNNCPILGTLINTNNMRGFQNLDRELLLKTEAKKVHT